MEFSIILLDVLAFAFLVLFAEELKDKHYEFKPIKFINVTKWVALVALAIMLLPAGVHVHFIWVHIVFHLAMVLMCCVGWKRFRSMRFKYPEQLGLVRWFLGITTVVEVAAIVLFVWYCY